MNTPCDLIRDLIPLYHDEICSQDSRKLVEDHVAGCAYCKGYLDGFRAAPVLQEEELKELGDLQAVQERWLKERKKVFFKRISLCVPYKVYIKNLICFRKICGCY